VFYNILFTFTAQIKEAMKKRYIILAMLLALTATAFSQTVIITTNIGTMKAKLYNDTPNHVRAFVARAKQGKFNGTLFTRVIPGFMIQGGSLDSRNAAPGARVGFADRSTEIMPEFRSAHFSKKGALAAPRQNDDINPKRKSDMSQFFIFEGKVYRSGELDTLELRANQKIQRKAMEKFYNPVENELLALKDTNKVEFNRRIHIIREQVDSMVMATPGHLKFTPEQREAYTTVGGYHYLDGLYTIYGEVTEGLDLIDKIANQPRDAYDRPKKDIRIISIKIE